MTEKLSAFDLETFISKLVDALPKFVGAAIIIALGFWVSALIGKLLIKGLERKGVDASIHSFLRSIVVWVLRFAVILSALSTLGFNLNSFIAALGAGAHGQVCKYAVFLDAVHQLLHIFIVSHLERVIDERMQFRKRYFRNKVAAFSLAVSL